MLKGKKVGRKGRVPSCAGGDEEVPARDGWRNGSGSARLVGS